MGVDRGESRWAHIPSLSDGDSRKKQGIRIWLEPALTTCFTAILLSAATPADSIGVNSTNLRTDPRARFTLDIVPAEVEPGGILKVMIRGSDEEATSAEGSLGDQELIFQESEGRREIFSIAGIDLETSPGKVPLTVVIRTRDGGADILRGEVTVREKTFGVQKLTLEEKPYTPERLERIKRESERLRSLWETITPVRYWRESFARPLPRIAITSEFGLKRFINDVPRKPHTGVDLRAAEGDTIYATNDGRVALSGDFYFSGNSIILDHGEGLYSMYFHLSAYLVGEGDFVKRGKPIGLAGSTGRATAPHLHWGIILRGARLDPLKILALPIGKER